MPARLCAQRVTGRATSYPAWCLPSWQGEPAAPGTAGTYRKVGVLLLILIRLDKSA